MARRLFKIAKEFNVGTTTVVDFLKSKDFDIANKPTAKITDEMYDELLKEYQDDADVKEKAEKLVIGVRIESEKKEVEKKPKAKTSSISSEIQQLAAQKKKQTEEQSETKVEQSLPVEEEVKKKDKETPKDVESPPVTEKVTAQESGEDLEKKEEVEKEASQEKSEKKGTLEEKENTEQKEEKGAGEETIKGVDNRPKLGLKVVGKIDLEVHKKKPLKEKQDEKSEAKKEPVKPESDKKMKSQVTQVTEKKAVNLGSEKAKETPPAELVKKEDDVMKVNAPSLKGLKVMGKIDMDTITPKKKKKSPPTESDSSTNSKRKRKRKRKTVTKTRGRGNTPSRTPNKRRQEEDNTVTQKEIEDKIKATMARMHGGGKSKRQKARRDKRESLKEKQAEDLANSEENNVIEVTEFISVSELAGMMEVSPTDIIMSCMNLGIIVSINQRLDAEIIELVASEFNFEVEFISAEEQIDDDDDWDDAPKDLIPRAPIVTVMGHVDHGKTSLLDYIRKANVVSGEAGGITQHIGAYEVEINNKRITFLDTPGHEAFTAMRARGAKITDVAIIIIAADDKIMPQTKEAISHAEAAGVPMVFAINKIDKDGADPERIINELAQMNYLVEAWGGKYQSHQISAKTGENIDKLLEKVALESELLELKANPDRRAIGTVLEASLDKGRGYVAKILVQNGTLNIGDPLVAGEHYGKVKAMFNERGENVNSVGPSQPTLVLGLSGAPQAGEKFKEMETEQEVKTLATKRAQILREQSNRASKRISLDEIGRRLALGTFKELNLIVKGDVDGSVEALSDSLIKLSVETIQVNVIHKAVGQIIESDILLASASDAIIIGFQVRPSGGARKLAEQEGVQIKMYSIIYEAIEEVKLAMEGMLEPTEEEKIVGQVEVREVYKISKVGTVAGCYIQEGRINRNNHIRIIRDGIVVYPTKEGVVAEIDSLKRYKEDIKEVKSGMECGISVKNFNDIKVGDIIEPYEIIEIKQTL